jgi:hypothetical protein
LDFAIRCGKLCLEHFVDVTPDYLLALPSIEKLSARVPILK